MSARTARFPMTPARWLTLVLGVPVLLGVIAFTGLSAVSQLGQASFPVSYSFTPTAGQLAAQLPGGSITLRQAAAGADHGDAVLSGTAHYSLVRSSVTRSGNTVRYHCPYPLGNCELNGTLQVPARTDVSLSTGGGDVTVPGYRGNLTVSTSGGNVTGGTLTGKIQIHTGGGSVNVTSLVDTRGLLSLSTSGGDITSQSVSAAYSDIRTGGGDISLKYTTTPTSLMVSTSGGNIRLVVPSGRYKVDAHTSGGTISNGIGNDPTARDVITVSTGGGDIDITSAS